MPNYTQEYIKRVNTESALKTFSDGYANLVGFTFFPDEMTLNYALPDEDKKSLSNYLPPGTTDPSTIRKEIKAHTLEQALKLQFARERTLNLKLGLPRGDIIKLYKVPVLDQGGGFTLKGGDVYMNMPVIVSVYLKEPKAFPVILGLIEDRTEKKSCITRRADPIPPLAAP